MLRLPKLTSLQLTSLLLLLSMGLPSRAQLSKADSLAQVIDHYPANDTTKMNRMVLLAKMLAYSDPSRGMKIIDAEMPAARQLNFKKGILEGYNVKSSLYFLQGNREQAQAVAEEYLQTATRYSDKPNEIVANSLLGILNSQSGNYAKALEYMLRSLKLAEEVGDKSKLAALNQNLGNVYNDMEDYDRAIADYSEAIRVDPQYAVAYSNRGLAYANKKDYDRAIKDLDGAIRMDPDNAPAYDDRGWTFSRKKQYDRAIADYNEAVRLDPKFARAYGNRCSAYREKRELDRAIADCDDAIRLDPKLAFAYNNRGNVYFDKKSYDRAIADYDEAIRLDPTLTVASDNRRNALRDKAAAGQKH